MSQIYITETDKPKEDYAPVWQGQTVYIERENETIRIYPDELDKIIHILGLNK